MTQIQLYYKGFEILFDDKLVEISFDEVLGDPKRFLNNVLTLMEKNKAQLNTFHMLLLELYRNKMDIEFENTLTRVVRFAHESRFSMPYSDDRAGYLHLCMLAASFYLKKLRDIPTVSSNENEKKELTLSWIELLRTLFAQFDADEYAQVKLQSSVFTATQAQFLIMQGDVKSASELTSRWCNIHTRDVTVLLVHALAKFLLRDFLGSLQTYQWILLLAPELDAPVRFGIGLCLAYLKYPEAAVVAFARQLEIAPQHVDSMVHTALIELNWFKTKPRCSDAERFMYLQSAADHLCRALELSKKHVLAHWLLAEIYSFSGSPELSKVLASRAFELTDTLNSGLCADALFSLGKSFHMLKDYKRASQIYSKSLKFEPKATHTLYALAQVSLALEDQPSALSALERIGSITFSATAACLLASLYLNHHSTRDQGHALVAKLQKSLSIDSNSLSKKSAFALESSFKGISSVPLLALLAEQLEKTSIKAALVAYNRLQQVLEELGFAVDELPVELFSNRASLLFLDNQLDKSQKEFEFVIESRLGVSVSTLDISSAVSQSDAQSFSNVSILYSYARLLETLGDTQRAKDIYVAIKKFHPGYLDAPLRLGVLLNKEMRDGGMEQLEEILQQNPQHRTTNLLIAYALMLRKEYRKARKRFEAALQLREKDEYAVCGIGHIFVETSRMATSSADCEHLLKSAFYMFTDRCLKYNPDNAYAINGLGMVLAERKMYNEAAHVFLQLRQFAKNIQGTSYRLEWLASFNYGSTVMELGKHNEAISTFETMIRRTDDPMDYILFQSVARGYYLRAREFRAQAKTLASAHDLSQRTLNDVIMASKYLQRAIHCTGSGSYPGMLYFDLAMTLQFYAELAGRYLPLNMLSKTELEHGRRYLATSSRLFELIVSQANAELEQTAPPSWTFMVRVKLAEERLALADDLAQRIDSRFAELREIAKTHEEKIAAALAQQRAEQEKLESERQKEQEAKRAAQLEREERQRKLEEQFKSAAIAAAAPESDEEASGSVDKPVSKKRKENRGKAASVAAAPPSKSYLSDEFVRESDSEDSIAEEASSKGANSEASMSGDGSSDASERRSVKKAKIVDGQD